MIQKKYTRYGYKFELQERRVCSRGSEVNLSSDSYKDVRGYCVVVREVVVREVGV